VPVLIAAGGSIGGLPLAAILRASIGSLIRGLTAFGPLALVRLTARVATSVGLILTRIVSTGRSVAAT